MVQSTCFVFYFSFIDHVYDIKNCIQHFPYLLMCFYFKTEKFKINGLCIKHDLKILKNNFLNFLFVL